MIFSIYKKALSVLERKPLRLWGISVLGIIIVSLISSLFALIPGVGIMADILIGTSMAVIFLKGYKGEQVTPEMLFESCSSASSVKRVLGGMAWMYLWVFIWGLIPIAGPVLAIIKAYSYRLTPYILVYEPDVKLLDAYKVSAQRTKGYKAAMFGADFIAVAAVFVSFIVLVILAQIPFIGFLFGAAAFVLIVGSVLLLPLLLGLLLAAFYSEIEKRRTTPVTPYTIPSYFVPAQVNQDGDGAVYVAEPVEAPAPVEEAKAESSDEAHTEECAPETSDAEEPAVPETAPAEAEPAPAEEAPEAESKENN